MTPPLTEQIPRGSLIVSCQAGGGNPLRSPSAMALMARAAVTGGAVAIRANGPEDVAAIRAVVDVPIVGINKIGDPAGVSITPTAESAVAVVAAGATIVALDGTDRPRPDGRRLAELVRRIRDHADVPLLADVDSVRAGVLAREAGADAVATTLSGYVGDEQPAHADIELIGKLAASLDCPVIAEGRIWTVDDVRAAREAGAYSVVVGTAVTNPMAITRRLAAAMADVVPAEAGS